MATLEEISATFRGERRRFENADGDVIIGSAFANSTINAEITIKGQADLDELQEGQTYRFYGKWAPYKNKYTGKTEQQFAFQSFVKEQPHGRDGIISYLRAAGEGLGLGNVRCHKLWELYGSEAVRELRENPAIVAAALCNAGLRISVENAEKISQALIEEQALESCTLDLMDVMTGRGFPKATSRLAVRQWGNKAAQIIRRNPYQLMNFRGCGFKKTDALYLDLGHNPNAIRRQGLCAWYTLARDNEGHTWFPLSMVDRGIRDSISGANLDLEKALLFARRLGAVSQSYTNGMNGGIVPAGSCRWLAEGKKAANEAELSGKIADAMREKPTLWPDVAEVSGIDDHQRGQLAKATTGMVGILGGGPGTGKTFTVGCLVKWLAAKIGINNVLIGAPTGKAAVRVTENLSKHGLKIKARTWHSLLASLDREVERNSGDKPKHFAAKVLIGDETSMNDTDLMAAIFRARSAGCHVLLVGDVNQLPPVGHGAPLRDMIAAGLPYGELTEIRRNSGMIVEACALMRQGRKYPVLRHLSEIDFETGKNLVRLSAFSPEQSIHQTITAIAWAKAVGFDPIWDCQVIVPVNKKSPLARVVLNKILQAELNVNAGVAGSPFRVGDKIVNTQNGYFPLVELGDDADEDATNERGEAYVANGELAKVLDVEPGYLIASLENPARTIKIPRGKASENTDDEKAGDGGDSSDSDKSTGTGCSWDLGYALSVHKSQGSEFGFNIVILDDYAGARMVCSREWLYTGDSRGKKSTIEIGKDETAEAMLRKPVLGKRKTLLKERIHLATATDILAEL